MPLFRFKTSLLICSCAHSRHRRLEVVRGRYSYSRCNHYDINGLRSLFFPLFFKFPTNQCFIGPKNCTRSHQPYGTSCRLAPLFFQRPCTYLLVLWTPIMFLWWHHGSHSNTNTHVWICIKGVKKSGLKQLLTYRGQMRMKIIKWVVDWQSENIVDGGKIPSGKNGWKPK